MTVKRGILWFSVGTIGLLFVFVAFCWGVIQWRKSAMERVDPLPRLERAVVDANLPCPEGEALRRYLLDNPAIIAELMKSEDFALRSAAHVFLRWYLHNHRDELRLKPEDATKFVDCMRRQYSDQQHVLFSVIGEIGPAGYLAVTNLFEDNRPLSAEQMMRMNWLFHEPDALDALLRLVAISQNEQIALTNRLQALDVIGFAKKYRQYSFRALEILRENENAELSRAARVAIARIQDEPTVERIEADIDWHRRYEPNSVKYYLRDLGAYGQRANAAGPVILRELKPLGDDTGQFAAIALAKIGYREAIPELIRALDSENDWELAAGAAEALGRLKATEAEDALVRLAERTVFPRLRSIALNAVQALHGDYEYSDRFDEIWAVTYLNSNEGHSIVLKLPWWQRFDLYDDLHDFWQDFKVGWIGLTSPRITKVEVEWPTGVLTENAFDMLPRHRFKMKGGLLLGYDEGEFGAGLVSLSKGKTPVFHLIPNVTEIVPWQDGALVLTGYYTQGVAYEVEYDAANGFVVRPFTRLPSIVGDLEIEANGSLVLYGELRLTTEGQWERVTERL